jgi:metacaspase-1
MTTTTRRKSARTKISAGRTRGKKSAPFVPGAAVSLHIGLNSVDPRHYQGWSGDLMACEQDAADMAAIAAASGMRSSVLLTRNATRKNVLASIRKAAKQLEAGDFFFLSYSGHGGQVTDVTGEEADKKDETWCLYDGQLIDDELYLELGQFAKGVRVLVLSDSCHSGTVTRAPLTEAIVDARGRLARPKLMPPAIANRTYEAHKRFYDALQQHAAKAARRKKVVDPDVALAQVAISPRLGAITTDFKPAVILISGCQDNQTSLDGDRNGAFTERLLSVWNQGAFTGNYARFHAVIKAGMPSSQTPNLFMLGDAGTFVTQHPFQVAAGNGKRVSVESAREFIASAAIPAAKRTRGARDIAPMAFDSAKTQAAVVGSDIVSFVSGVTAERREAIVNSSLLAQLVATKKVSNPSRIYEWYDTYFDVLTNLGWVVQDKGFAEYKESSANFDAHKAILAVAAVVLGAAPTALAIVTSTINALHSMDDTRPWIAIFNRESKTARTARFQISLAEQDTDGQFFVNLMAFGLEASDNVTQVLFFKVRKQDAKLRHYSGRVTINGTVLDGVRDVIKAKLVAQTSAFVSQLPDL